MTDLLDFRLPSSLKMNEDNLSTSKFEEKFSHENKADVEFTENKADVKKEKIKHFKL